VGAPVRVEVPAVGLSTAVLPIRPTDGELDPPTFGEAYWIEPYGYPGSDNTTYITGHSATRGSAVFDPLFDRASQRARVHEGDEVVVTTAEGRFSYRVTSSVRHAKGRLAQADDVWAKVPDRLVLITCFQRSKGGASRDNLVVFADLQDAPVRPG
jgi:sortase (surface protein transpeptidase)